MRRHRSFRRGEGRPKRYETALSELAPGVTTIVKASLDQSMLIGWANKVGRNGLTTHEASVEARDTGTLAHLFIEHWIEPVPDVEVRAAKCKRADVERAEEHCKRFEAWATEQGDALELVATETPLVSNEHCFGGTIDLLARWDPGPELQGGLWVVDVKTGKGPYPEWVYQLAAYGLLVHEHHGEAIAGGAVIHTHEDAKQICHTWTAAQLRPAAQWFVNATRNHHIHARTIAPMLGF